MYARVQSQNARLVKPRKRAIVFITREEEGESAPLLEVAMVLHRLETAGYRISLCTSDGRPPEFAGSPRVRRCVMSAVLRTSLEKAFDRCKSLEAVLGDETPASILWLISAERTRRRSCDALCNVARTVDRIVFSGSALLAWPTALADLEEMWLAKQILLPHPSDLHDLGYRISSSQQTLAELQIRLERFGVEPIFGPEGASLSQVFSRIALLPTLASIKNWNDQSPSQGCVGLRRSHALRVIQGGKR